MTDSLRTSWISAVIFLIIVVIGCWASARLPLWLDEHVSLETTTSLSYGTLISGQYTRESNNSPLFYLTQKALLDAAGYSAERLGIIDIAGRPHPFERYWHDPLGNRLLRIFPLIMMALSLALLFYYFTLRDGLRWGLFAVLFAASYPLFWYHGFEARPYIHFYAMTTAQFLIAVDMLRAERISTRQWWLLGATHLCLALTFTTSAVQIGAVFVTLYCWRRKELDPVKILGVFVLPIGIIAYYYLIALKLTYFFDRGILVYLIENFSVEALFMGLVALVVIMSTSRDRKDVRRSLAVACLFAAVLSAYIAAMIFVGYQAAGQGSHPFYGRYLFNLAAVGTVMMVVFSRQLMGLLPQGWPRCFLTSILGALLISRFCELAFKMAAWGRYQWIG